MFTSSPNISSEDLLAIKLKYRIEYSEPYLYMKYRTGLYSILYGKGYHVDMSVVDENATGAPKYGICVYIKSKDVFNQLLKDLIAYG